MTASAEIGDHCSDLFISLDFMTFPELIHVDEIHIPLEEITR